MEHGATAHGRQTTINQADAAGNGQQLAASPVSIVDSIVITEERDPDRIIAEWIAYDPSIAVYSELRATQSVKLFLNWSDRNGTVDLQQGDYFTFVVPDIFMYEYIANVSNVPIRDEFGEIVATYSIYDNSNNMKEVRIVFTDYVENHTDISGDFWMLLYVGSVASTEQKDLEFVINDDLVAQGQVTVNPNAGNYTPRNLKNGFSSPTMIEGGFYIFQWTVYFNMGENAVNGFNILEGFSFEDIIPADSPHVFLTNAIRQELGLSPTDYAIEIGEYTGADAAPPELRYQVFRNQFNSIGAGSWYDFINWYALVNGLITAGIGGANGLQVSAMEVTDKLFSAILGTVTRPTIIKFYTISTIRLTESALGDTEVVGLFTNLFRGSYGEELNASLTLYRFEAGGSAQGIIGDYSFAFTKVNQNDAALPGAMFALYTSDDFSAGADRFVFSDGNGVVSFVNLPEGIYYFHEVGAPYGYRQNTTIYRVTLTSTGFTIHYGPDFEIILVDNRIINGSEIEILPALVILPGRKDFIGAPLTDGMFNFVVKDFGGTAVATGVNYADGSIQFSSIVFNEVGVFTLTVEEIEGTDSRIIYDGTIFTVTVTITDDGSGSLIADVTYPAGGIVFSNSFVESSVSVTLLGTKNLVGGSLEDGMFSFFVRDSAGSAVAIGINNADGSIQFSSIAFSEPGVYAFTVEEVMGSDSRIIYDGTIFDVTVVVTESGDGTLAAEVIYPDGGIVFNNSFVTSSVSVTFVGRKYLSGRVLTGGMFSFVVKYSAGNTVAVGTNNADGSIQFSSIAFSEAGIFAFTVEEVKGTNGSIIYDGSVFAVTVAVTDDGGGNLTAEVTYPEGGIAFVNRYEDTPEKPCPCVRPCRRPCCNPCVKPACVPRGVSCRKPASSGRYVSRNIRYL